MTKQTNEDLKLTNSISKIVLDEVEPEEVFQPIPEKTNSPADGYYIQFDIESHSDQIKRKLNSYMVRHDAFDPRKGHHHPSDLLANTNLKDNLTSRRIVLGISSDRYECWKVKADFSLKELNNFFRSITVCDASVRALVIMDNEHTMYRFFTNN